MKRLTWIWGTMSACAIALAFAAPATAQDKKDDKPKPEAKKPDAKPAAGAKQDDKKPAAGAPAMSPEDAKAMKNMEEAGKVTENHKLLADNLAGEWTYESKMWQGPEPEVSTGTCSTKAIFGGRYLRADHKGSMQMPGPDGKMTEMQFEGASITGYDNIKKKFFGTWMDSMSTGLFVSEGTYDAGTKTFTYTGEMPDCMQDFKIVKIRHSIRIIDKDKHVFEWYQPMNGKETKTMEITYTRKK
jgi:hypothetical protein